MRITSNLYNLLLRSVYIPLVFKWFSFYFRFAIMDSSPEYVNEEDEEIVDDPVGGNTKSKSSKAGLKKVFQRKWLLMSEFKGWLAPVKNDVNSAKCMACGVNVRAGKSELEKHAKTKLHEKAVKAFKFAKPISTALNQRSEREIHAENVKKMELQLAAFFAEHNLAYLTADHLLSVIQTAAKDSKIAADVKLGPINALQWLKTF